MVVDSLVVEGTLAVLVDIPVLVDTLAVLLDIGLIELVTTMGLEFPRTINKEENL